MITVLAQSQTCLAVRYKCEKGPRAVYCRRGQGRPGCRGQTNAPSSQELCCNPLFSQPFFSSFAFVFSFCLSLFFVANFGFSLATCYFECTYSQEQLQLHLHEYDLLPFLEELRQKLHFQESDSIQTSKLSKSSLAKPYCWKLLLKSQKYI